MCTDARCLPGTDDSSWRSLSVPHDFVVEGNYSQSADMSHGYLPYAVGWYRKHFTLTTSPAPPPSTNALWLDLDGVFVESTVYLNGELVGFTNASGGYTQQRYYLPVDALNWTSGADNVLVVRSDATHPSGWWYDGGGIYRNVWLTYVQTPGPFFAPWGLYAPSNVTGDITWSTAGQPSADAVLTPSVEVSNNASTTQSFTITLAVLDPSGNTVGTAGGSGSVGPNSTVVWSPASPISLPAALLWHLVSPPLKPSLYTLQALLTVGTDSGTDFQSTTFGVRATRWDAATGFYLNGVATKILGTANHQDFAAVGAAVPDHLQWHRVAKLKEMGVNGWRTAHNPPTPALLDAADELGMLVWDENHKNGQFDAVPLLIKRDRNHPSVVIWSICNEVLCDTTNGDWVANALAMKALMKELDPLGGRPVSANQNGWLGPNTPLDLQGIDYNTASYDKIHAAAPNIPSISSETSSAVSDRGVYVTNSTAGHVSGYDDNYPGWGQTAEGAWGGIGEPNNEGILTRSFVSGGWTWTGWDYRGEPTPTTWPTVNSHFGIIDLAGFPKDRFFWYKAWFPTRGPADAPSLYVFPSTWSEQDWKAGQPVDVWAFSDADEVELFLNGASQGRFAMTRYSHLNWTVPFTPGSLQGVAYRTGSSMPVATFWVNTTGVPAALRLSVQDGFGADGLYAGCNDVALVKVEVVDANGAVVPYADSAVTFSVAAGSPAGAEVAGTSNGDPACLVNNVSPTRPAFHGMLMAVVRAGDEAGSLTVTASADGFATQKLTLPVTVPDFTADPSAAKWCRGGMPSI